MDMNSVYEFMENPGVLYAAAGAAGALIGSGLTVLLGRGSRDYRLNKAAMERDVRLAEEETKRAEYETLKHQALASVELRRIDAENAEGEHKRKLEVMDRERQYKLDDEGRQRAERLEDLNAERLHQLTVAGRLESVNGALREYLAKLSSVEGDNPALRALHESRQEYREELAEEYTNGLRTNDALFSTEENDYGSSDNPDPDDAADMIDKLVDLKYPLSTVDLIRQCQVQLPPEVKGLIRFLTADNSDRFDLDKL